MDFGRAVRVARAARGLSQKELAEGARVKPSYVSMLERGVRENPSADVMDRIALALRVPVYVLAAIGSTREELGRMAPAEQSAIARAVLASLCEGEIPPPVAPVILSA